jgi:hypothetical protein
MKPWKTVLEDQTMKAQDQIKNIMSKDGGGKNNFALAMAGVGVALMIVGIIPFFGGGGDEASNLKGDITGPPPIPTIGDPVPTNPDPEPTYDNPDAAPEPEPTPEVVDEVAFNPADDFGLQADTLASSAPPAIPTIGDPVPASPEPEPEPEPETTSAPPAIPTIGDPTPTEPEPEPVDDPFAEPEVPIVDDPEPLDDPFEDDFELAPEPEPEPTPEPEPEPEPEPTPEPAEDPFTDPFAPVIDDQPLINDDPVGEEAQSEPVPDDNDEPEDTQVFRVNPHTGDVNTEPTHAAAPTYEDSNLHADASAVTDSGPEAWFLVIGALTFAYFVRRKRLQIA